MVAAALLSVPRAAAPNLFPVPLVDVRDAAEFRRRTASAADAAEREGLPFETRAVGDAIRRWGAALSSGVGDVEYLNRLTRERVEAALAAGQIDQLVRLRAVQARLFVRTLRAWSWSPPAPPELRELGGDFATRAENSEWVEGGRCLATDDELITLFNLRWLELTRLREHPRFKPTLGELRRYYRFLLLYPEQAGSAARGTRDERAIAARRLRYVEALSKVDGEYPVHLARGALLGQLGQSQGSARDLTAQLLQASERFRLRARNYLLYAAEDVPEEEVEGGFVEPP